MSRTRSLRASNDIKLNATRKDVTSSFIDKSVHYFFTQSIHPEVWAGVNAMFVLSRFL